MANPATASKPSQPSLHKNLLTMIGNTPMVQLNNLNPNPSVEIYAKLEGMNPSGSIKDRIALNMIETAERRGELDGGKVLLEPSSGNTAIALAMVTTVKGYELSIVMPSNVSVERKEVLRGFNVNIIESPADQGTNGSVFKARRIAREDDQYIMLDQYANPANPRAHYHGTGPEMIEQLPRVDRFVAGLGTGGTLMGAGRALREAYPDVELIGIQPEPERGLRGLRNLEDGFIPEIIEVERLDGKELIRKEDAFEYVRRLASEEGIFAGVSSGAAAAKCVKFARQMDHGVIATVFPDGGWKYLSLKLWSRPLGELDESVEGPLW